MQPRLDRRSVVVEWLGRGRAVVMTADGAFREVKLPGRLARRGFAAVGHELGARRTYHRAGRPLPHFVYGKPVGWAAVAAVFAGLVLGAPVRGWLVPFDQLTSEQPEYRLTTTIHPGHDWETAAFAVAASGAPGAVSSAGRSPVAAPQTGGDRPASVVARHGDAGGLTPASRAFVLSPAQVHLFVQSSVDPEARPPELERRGDAVSTVFARGSSSSTRSALLLSPARPVAHRTPAVRRTTVTVPRTSASTSEGWATHASR